ncbi:unnamed protein product, partial [Rotaria magnacalcarata]
MTDIRNFFKKVSTANKKRTRDDPVDHEEITSTAKLEQKLSTKISKEKVVSQTKTNINTTPPKKMKTKEIDPIEKKKRFENYKSFINRGGPDAPGSKTIPDGEKNCLKNLTFVISGILESLERDECKNLIEKYGGRVTVALSGKTNYLIAGREPSEGKLNKARATKVAVISEDDLLELIQTRPGDEVTPKKKVSTTSESSSTQLKRKSSST